MSTIQSLTNKKLSLAMHIILPKKAEKLSFLMYVYLLSILEEQF